jgi:hypothetical protein
MTANKEAWFDGDYYNITVLYITKMEMKWKQVERTACL